MINPRIVVHGGCGRVEAASIPDRREGVKQAAQEGWKVLAADGYSIDAVEAAVVVLEDNPLFNAGRGSVLTNAGRVETDAAIMDGQSLAAGAIAGVAGFFNPIHIARRVMDATPHVLLVGEGAEQFARSEGFVEHDMEELIATYRRSDREREHGTVGAVACDSGGRVAAATSTGGSRNKLPGRVGDTPLIGAGTYANSRIAVSCTGDGEKIIRMTLSRLVAEYYLEYGDLERASQRALDELEATLGGEVGLVVADSVGRGGFVKNSPHMPVCAIDRDGVQIYC